MICVHIDNKIVYHFQIPSALKKNIQTKFPALCTKLTTHICLEVEKVD